jgi:hypothetical protein
MTSYLPVTIDGSEILPEAPRSQGMGDTQAQTVSDAAESYRETVMHCHYDITDRTVTATAANVPGETVAFSFGDRTGDIDTPVEGGQAEATHTYQSDGVFELSVRTATDRWSTEVAVNFPPYGDEAPA